eukprot:CAMPEP_0113944870 /NCGR_PEP_ID=MMETSP1339-20121228/37415_1 /TAXON_ID=94617 /ORGANISM="Fibrocapsa japonica" /LENGTH=389 /DNA_ID=CAMNT_0000950211 /DNA_START=307 /DNA_END=1476 /DNA_ORIENTATION=- /assembly_acc=CAM_ASM_000762
MTSVANGLADAATAASDTATAAAAAGAQVQDAGWLQPIVSGIEAAIVFMHTAGLNYGVAIILFTAIIKAVTYPLTYTQIASTTKMQAVAPKIKEIQAKVGQTNPERANQLIADLYQKEQVNPLAGCVPALVQIPIFISLYRALLNLAAEEKLNEAFLWLPSLDGPTYGASPADGMNWLKTGWEDGVPPLGWPDTLAFLTLPVILVISQYISTQIMQPKVKPGEPDPMEQNQLLFKVLPLMIGYFSLNVPSGLAIYWVANNFLTTGLTLFVRKQVEAATAGPQVVTASSSTEAPPTNQFEYQPKESWTDFKAEKKAKKAAARAAAISDPDVEVLDAEVVPAASSADAEEVAPVAAEVSAVPAVAVDLNDRPPDKPTRKSKKGKGKKKARN